MSNLHELRDDVRVSRMRFEAAIGCEATSLLLSTKAVDYYDLPGGLFELDGLPVYYRSDLSAMYHIIGPHNKDLTNS